MLYPNKRIYQNSRNTPAFRHGEYVKRTFPLYLEDDTNANPTGGICEIQYKLVDGEACRILKLVKYTIYNIVDEKVMK